MNEDEIIFDSPLVASYELLPCPFCGSTNTAVCGTFSAFGVCRDCESSTGLYLSQTKAAEAWNRRSKTIRDV